MWILRGTIFNRIISSYFKSDVVELLHKSFSFIKLIKKLQTKMKYVSTTENSNC